MRLVLTKPYVPSHQRMLVTVPVGLLYLASYVRRFHTEIKIDIIDPDIFSGTFDEFINAIVQKKPDIIGISVFSHMLNPTKRMVSILKEMVPKSDIVVGGPHINSVSEKALTQLPNVEFGICGEGERGLLEFCRQLFSDGMVVSPEAIPGLVYRSDSKVFNTQNTYNDNLDEFDPLDFELININDYFSLGSPMGLFRRGNHVAQIITTRGCPFPCTFCASPLNMGKKVRKRSTMSIVNEIENIISLGGDEIHIMDDNFTLDRDHVISLCKEIFSRQINISFCMPNGVRLDWLDDEMLVWMKKAGWYHLGFGIEVGSDEALKNIRKGITMAEIKEKIAMVKKTGFTTTGFFILGLPHDNLDTMRETAGTPDKLGLDMASFGNYTPLPGTQIYDKLIKEGEIEEEYLPSFSSGEITYSPKGISKHQLDKIQRNIVFKYWLHPRRIKLILSRLKFRDIVYVIRRLYLIIFRPKSDE